MLVLLQLWEREEQSLSGHVRVGGVVHLPQSQDLVLSLCLKLLQLHTWFLIASFCDHCKLRISVLVLAESRGAWEKHLVCYITAGSQVKLTPLSLSPSLFLNLLYLKNYWKWRTHFASHNFSVDDCACLIPFFYYTRHKITALFSLSLSFFSVYHLLIYWMEDTIQSVWKTSMTWPMPQYVCVCVKAYLMYGFGFFHLL